MNDAECQMFWFYMYNINWEQRDNRRDLFERNKLGEKENCIRATMNSALDIWCSHRISDGIKCDQHTIIIADGRAFIIENGCSAVIEIWKKKTHI